jgi:CRP-like cAMP-binding protein
MSGGASPLEVPPRAAQFLEDHRTLTLASATPAGVPRATDLRYVSDGLTLYVWLRSESWTAKQINRNPSVAFTISEESTSLQGTGNAQVVIAGAEVARAVELFAAKFPTALGASTMNISFFRISPTSIKLVDESYGGGRGETRVFAEAEYRVEDIYDVVRELPPGEAGLIAGRLHTLAVEGGATVAREGAPADKFVVVLEGEVTVSREGEHGTEQLAVLGPGDFFGEISILTDAPRTATLTAAGPAKLLTMERDDFITVVAQALGTNENFDRILRERLATGGP